MPLKKQLSLIYARSDSNQSFRVYDETLSKNETGHNLKQLTKERETARIKSEEFFQKVIFGHNLSKIKWHPHLVHRPTLGQDIGGVFWRFSIKFKEYCENKKIETIYKEIKTSQIMPIDGLNRSYRPFNSPIDVIVVDGYSNLQMPLSSSIKGYEVTEINKEEYEKNINQCTQSTKQLEIFKLNKEYQFEETTDLMNAIYRVVSQLNKNKICFNLRDVVDFFSVNNYDYEKFLNLEELKPKTYPPGVPFGPGEALWYFLDKNRNLLTVN